MIRIRKGSRLRKTAPRALTIALALGIGLGTASCANDPTAEAAQYVASGDKYAANRQFEEAVIEYGRAIKARPNWGKAHFKRGQAYLEKGDAAKALKDHLRAADLDAADGVAQIQAGTLLLLAGQFDAARRYAERATSNSAESAAAHTLLGNALAGLQQSASAIGEIEQAIELDPAFAPAWTALGSAQLRSGDRQQALDAFNRAVALAPASLEARLSLAHYHWATGSASDAERVLREALALQPENPTVHRALALFYMTTGRGNEAEAHFTALATNPAGTLDLADYYQATGRPARALDVLRSMQNADDKKDQRAARLKIAAIEYESGQKASAYRIVDELIAEQPKREEPKIAKARLLIRDDDPEQAARLAKDALTLNRQSASAHYTLGLAALAVQNLNEAEASFNEVARINPRAGAARLQLARIHLARGDAKKAAVVAAEAARANPNDVNAAALSVRSLRTAGERDRAERELNAKLKEQPGSAVLNVEQGWLALQRQQLAPARAAFGRALEADPVHREARAGLVATELAGGSVKSARALVENWLAESPSDVSLRILLAQVQLRTGDSGAGGTDASGRRRLDAVGRRGL